MVREVCSSVKKEVGGEWPDLPKDEPRAENELIGSCAIEIQDMLSQNRISLEERGAKPDTASMTPIAQPV